MCKMAATTCAKILINLITIRVKKLTLPKESFIRPEKLTNSSSDSVAHLTKPLLVFQAVKMIDRSFQS